MKTLFLSKLVFENIIGSKYVRLHDPFRFYSETLGQFVEIPAGFVSDLESVPIIKGTSNIGGVVHDYFCRSDSKPVVTKQQAADLYKEVQKYRDSLLNEGFFSSFSRLVRRNIKTLIVRVAPGYFHKRRVMWEP